LAVFLVPGNLLRQPWFSTEAEQPAEQAGFTGQNMEE